MQYCSPDSHISGSGKGRLKIFLIFSSGGYSAEQNGLCNFGGGNYEGHFCERYFLSTALTALLFGGVEPFVQFKGDAF